MKQSELPEVTNLGEGRTLRFSPWDSDAVVHFTMYHPAAKDTPWKKQGEECAAGGFLDVPERPPRVADGQVWHLEAWEPFTVSPSVLCCLCGDHGWIKEGRWLPA